MNDLELARKLLQEAKEDWIESAAIRKILTILDILLRDKEQEQDEALVRAREKRLS